jgi:hypothetical protein
VIVKSTWHTCGHAARRACHDFLHHGDLPGYALLPWCTRVQLNLRALAYFLCSGECLRLATYLIIWFLAARLLVWTRDLQGPAAAAPGMLAAVWVWPWLASARRRRIAALLHHRWPD